MSNRGVLIWRIKKLIQSFNAKKWIKEESIEYRFTIGGRFPEPKVDCFLEIAEDTIVLNLEFYESYAEMYHAKHEITNYQNLLSLLQAAEAWVKDFKLVIG
ncbi:MAG: hypothetical protein SAK29_33150 [Scytonema sp. PMC 1069.18]|nr:hypothetical protein [Scytonema sp. PMC 1069.18]MEC4887292.1 hypothetical protein [Scytonema sp. PMC 1070.18]